jgi:hypothetical protein
MKKVFLFFFIFFTTLHAYSQTGIFFQAIARDNNANPAKDRKLYVQTNIIQSTTTGTIVLTEEHQTFTDAFGIFSIMVGSGKRVGGTVTGLSTIDWAKDPYYLNIKIVITPIAASNTWDYTKEWIDIGTTIFGAVPFALYSANTANINNKLNAADTTKMLEPYAKGKAVQVLTTTIDTKLATKDTSAMLAPYAKLSYSLDSNYLKKQIVSLLGASDTTKYTKQTYTDSALLTKMNIFDKSIYTKQIYTDSALLTKLNITGSAAGLTNFPILNQNTTGNAAFATTATTATTAGTSSTATKLAIARNINNVAFDGSGDITITADAGTLTGNTLNSTVTNSSLTSVGTLTNTIISGKLVVGATSAASNSAVLEASSTTQGFLPPRMATTQRDAILSPVAGLTIWCSNCGASGEMQVFNGGTWTNMIGGTTAGISTEKILTSLSIAAKTSSVLEASSTTQGFLPPRMNYYQRTQINLPIAGLTIWCTNCGASGEMQIFNGIVWTNMIGAAASLPIKLSIGDAYQGGLVAYILLIGDPGYDANTQHGLIVSNAIQGNIKWYEGNTIRNRVYKTTNARGTAIGTGLSNSNTIIAIQGEPSTSYAAGLARAYNGGGYTDWYLPSANELAKLFAMKKLGFGNFITNNFYWTSTEFTNNIAKIQYLLRGEPSNTEKFAQGYVRAIRAF